MKATRSGINFEQDGNDIQHGSIPKTSRIKFNKIFILEKSLVVKRLGKANTKKLSEVQKALSELLMLSLFEHDKNKLKGLSNRIW